MRVWVVPFFILLFPRGKSWAFPSSWLKAGDILVSTLEFALVSPLKDI